MFIVQHSEKKFAKLEIYIRSYSYSYYSHLKVSVMKAIFVIIFLGFIAHLVHSRAILRRNTNKISLNENFNCDKDSDLTAFRYTSQELKSNLCERSKRISNYTVR